MISLTNTLTDEQMAVLGDLFSRGSLSTLKHTVRGVEELDYFQTVAVAYSIISKSCLLNIDTGLGKTLIAAAIINCIRAQKPRLKWVYLCQCSNLKSTADKLKSFLFNSELTYCDSTEQKMLETFCSRKAALSDVIVLSYEAITQPVVENFLFKNRALFKGIFLDESQMMSNLTSHTSRLISAIFNSTEYRYMLSATPLRIQVEQVLNQIYMLDRDMFAGVTMSTFINQFRVWDDKQVIGYKHLDILQQMLMPRMLSLSRSDLGSRGTYVPKMRICTAGLDPDSSITEVIDYKNNRFSSTARALVETVQKYKAEGKRGLIYANRNVIKKAIKEMFEGTGISVGVMDGSTTTTQAKKDKVHKAFLAGEYDVLITNITTGKDLPCQYIIFYELTFDYKQMIGRGERGLAGVDLDIVFIITDSLYEMRYFYANVYQRGILLEQLCAKDLPELHGAMKQLEDKLREAGMDLDELVDA